MTTRLLPREEWPRLGEDSAWRAYPPQSLVVVVEREGLIVGRHALLPYWHVEDLWVASEDRGRSSVARRLWGGVQRAVRALGVPAVLTAAIDARVEGLLKHVHARPLPGTHYVIVMGED